MAGRRRYSDHRRPSGGPGWKFAGVLAACFLVAFLAVFFWRGDAPRAPIGSGPEPVEIADAPDRETLIRQRWPDTPARLEADQPAVGASGGASSGPAPSAGAEDALQARFARCSGPVRETCVVDGDTFWYRGTKIRVADIDAPEIANPGCRREAQLGERATRRLTALLNQGAFSLERVGRDTDRFGRTLREVRRGGVSLGERLVAEGLAERWGGPRIAWC